MSKASTSSSQHLHLHRLFHRIDGQVQGQHAGRAQHHVVELQLRLDQGHPRQLALRHELALSSTTIQARSRSSPVSVSTASRNSIPAQDLTG
jgi:hypothetical protein